MVNSIVNSSLLSPSNNSYLHPTIQNKIQLLLESSDKFLGNLLQPKLEIANYIESEGILTPKRYSCQKEAIESNQKYIIRSEHPQDYEGISGLLKSFVVEAGESFNETEYIESLERGENTMLNEYLEFNNIEIEDFLSKLSFSYWKYIEGRNLIMVQDEVSEDRFHFFSGVENNQSNFTHLCSERGNHIFGNDKLFSETEQKELIKIYKNISQLQNFDSLQCPNIELQIGNDGNIYFLQYKRGHQKELHNWELGGKLHANEISAEFVRGMTPPEGIKLNMLSGFTSEIYYPEKTKYIFSNLGDITKYPHEVVIKKSEQNRAGLHGLTSYISQGGVHIKIKNSNLGKENEKIISLTHYLRRPLERLKLNPLPLEVHVHSDGKTGKIDILTNMDSLQDGIVSLLKNESNPNRKRRIRNLFSEGIAINYYKDFLSSNGEIVLCKIRNQEKKYRILYWVGDKMKYLGVEFTIQPKIAEIEEYLIKEGKI